LDRDEQQQAIEEGVMIKIIAIAVAVLLVVGVAGVLAYAATKPDTFRVQRAIAIQAPAEAIFPFINDLRAQSSWSPFEKDPAMKRTHSGAAQGPGATYEWDGNREVGAGRIAITDATVPTRVLLALDMTRPMAAHNQVEFTLHPQGGTTNVTWTMHGEQPYMAKVMSTFIDCDKMVGGMFEDGLAKLKALVETQVAAVPAREGLAQAASR
jgi:hypothetical protein